MLDNDPPPGTPVKFLTEVRKAEGAMLANSCARSERTTLNVPTTNSR
jgi:hypothetical protein